MGTLQGYVPKWLNSFRVYTFAMYQMCRVILMVFSAMPDNVPGIREWNSTYRLELEYKQCLWTQIMLYTKLPKTLVNTVGILKY